MTTPTPEWKFSQNLRLIRLPLTNLTLTLTLNLTLTLTLTLTLILTLTLTLTLTRSEPGDVNHLIFCDGCGLCVHMFCYGMNAGTEGMFGRQSIESIKFLCDVRTAKRRPSLRPNPSPNPSPQP